MESQPGTLGVYLSQLRVAKGVSVTELAKTMGVRRATVSEWLAGKRRPRLSDLLHLLDLLQITEAQRRRAVSLYQAPTTIFLPEAVAQVGEASPHGGDLLRALRMRRGWTQEQTAQAIGVTQSQVAKWERGMRWPDTGDLHNLCQRLNAREEELVALTIGGFRLGSGHEDDPEVVCDPPTVAREFVALFDWPVTPEKVVLTDLRYLTLAAKAWRSAQYYPESACTLVDIYGTYAERLYLQRKHREAITMAQRALKLARKTPDSVNWPRALIRLADAHAMRADRESIKRGAALLDYWLPAFDPRQPEYTAWGLATRARLLSVLGYQEAVPITREAMQIARRCDGTSEAEYRTLDYTETLLNLGKPEEARDTLNALKTDMPATTLMQSEIYYALGDLTLSMEWLAHTKQSLNLYFPFNAHQIPYFNSRIEALEERQKEMH